LKSQVFRDAQQATTGSDLFIYLFILFFGRGKVLFFWKNLAIFNFGNLSQVGGKTRGV